MPHNNSVESCIPVNIIETGSTGDNPQNAQPGIALCLSGGGYRAMLFHVGALWRLNEWAYLRNFDRISSVSGGSITAGVLGFKWSKLAFDANGVGQAFVNEVVKPIRAMADRTIDQGSIIGGIFTPGSIADKVAGDYKKHLFGDATLQDLPNDPPRFVINATSVQSGALFRFSKPYLADYRVGMMKKPTVPLAVAVAASSAFPPVLSPLELELDASKWESMKPGEDLHKVPYLTEAVLTDGGVYDNLGLETAWKRYQTVLVSDGGGKMSEDPEPKGDWAQHAIRVNSIIDNQVRNLRKRQLINSYETHLRQGAYWGIRADIKEYGLPDAMVCPFDKTTELANTKTRLQRLDAVIQERLINWGYAITDAAVRKWVDSKLPKPIGFPYPGSGVG